MLKKFDSSDLQIAAKYIQEVYSNPTWNEKWTLERAKRRIKYFTSSLASLSYTIQSENEIIGFLFGRIDVIAEDDIFYLDELFIHPAFQKKGHGFAALQQLETELRAINISRIELHTITDDIRFYNKCGYTNSAYIHFEKKL